MHSVALEYIRAETSLLHRGWGEIVIISQPKCTLHELLTFQDDWSGAPSVNMSGRGHLFQISNGRFYYCPDLLDDFTTVYHLGE